MAIEGWNIVASFGDRISAQALAGLLESEAMPCLIVSNGPVPGLGTEFAVLVPSGDLRRAQFLSAQSNVSEEELTYLATGELPGGTGEH